MTNILHKIDMTRLTGVCREASIEVAPVNLTDHDHRRVISGLLGGKLCDQLTQRPGRKFSPGEFIFVRGDTARSIYFLRQGLVKTTISSEEGEELILGVHKPGEVFGELCLCSGERRAQAVAMEATEVVEIRFDDLITHLQQNRQALTNFLTNVVQHLSEAYDQLRMLAFEKTLQRMALALLKLAQKLGKPTAEGVEIEHYLRQEELAQMIGVAREVASSTLNHLRTMGLVTYSRKGRITVNTKALQAYLNLPEALKGVASRESYFPN